MEIWQISCPEDVRQGKMDVPWPRGLRWRAMIFHMARRTGFREQYYTGTRDISVSGKITGNIKVKLYVLFWWLFINISRFISSFGLSLFVVQENIDMLQWIATASSIKSIWGSTGEAKIRYSDRFMIFNAIWVPVSAIECWRVPVNPVIYMNTSECR